MKLVLENYGFLVYMYYTHPGYRPLFLVKIVRITFEFLRYARETGTAETKWHGHRRT